MGDFVYQKIEVTVGWTEADIDAREIAKQIGTDIMRYLFSIHAQNPSVFTEIATDGWVHSSGPREGE